MNLALKGYDDATLRKELEDRRIARVTAAQTKNQEWLDKAKYVLTNDIIDFLAPTHRREDECGDDRLWSGFTCANKGQPVPCLRCGLMEIARGSASANLDGLVVELKVELDVQVP